MTNNYQKNAPRTTAELRLALPAAVSVAIGEIAEDMQDGLLALAVGAGLQVMTAVMEADVGGFNWLSQHLDLEVGRDVETQGSDGGQAAGSAAAVGGGSGVACADAFAWAA